MGCDRPGLTLTSAKRPLLLTFRTPQSGGKVRKWVQNLHRRWLLLLAACCPLSLVVETRGRSTTKPHGAALFAAGASPRPWRRPAPRLYADAGYDSEALARAPLRWRDKSKATLGHFVWRSARLPG